MNTKLVDAEGVRAIIALQRLAGIVETEEQAREGWDSLEPWQQEHTMKMFVLYCCGKGGSA